MTKRMRGLAKSVWGLAAGLLVVAGCGPQERAAVGDVAVAESARSATAAKNSVALESAKIEWYWTFGRFLYDKHQVVRREPMFDVTRLTQAQLDSDFFTEWTEMGVTIPDGTTRSDAYVWGLVRSGSDLWFGTVSNMICFSLENDFLWGLPSEVRVHMYVPGYWECNFQDGPFADWRPPHLYRYETAPSPGLHLMDPDDAAADDLRKHTAGFRSAGTARGKDGTPVVFLAGPSNLKPENGAPGEKAIVIFAFNGENHQFIGAKLFDQWDNVRTWAAIPGDETDQLYMGVSVADIAQANRGEVVRWVGGSSADEEDPNYVFAFQTVGTLESEAGNLAVHEDPKTHEKRVYVATWPVWVYGGNQDPSSWKGMSLYRSPVILEGGLTQGDAGKWTKLWTITDYERDIAAAVTSAGGIIESYGGYVYWGTMHVPFSATGIALMNSELWPLLNSGGTVTIDAALVQRVVNWMLGSHRNPALFRGRDVPTRNGGTKFQVELVYGEKYLPRAVLPIQGGDGVYRIDTARPYQTGYTPLYGASGFGNFFNAYNWSSAKYDGKLWVGTFDWVQLIRAIAESLVTVPPPPDSDLIRLIYQAALAFYDLTGTWVPRDGADLYRFDSVDVPAVAEDLTGLGNPMNYGFRTMTTDDGHLYVGTANPMNLSAAGGWELLELSPPMTPPP